MLNNSVFKIKDIQLYYKRVVKTFYVAIIIILSLVCSGFTWGKSKEQNCKDANELIISQQIKSPDSVSDDLQRKVNELCPDGFAQKMLQGIKLEGSKQPDQAMTIYGNIINSDGFSPDAHGRLGILQLAKGDKSAAMVSLTKALENGGKNPSYHSAMAELLLDTQAYPLALYHFEQSIAVGRQPDSATLDGMAKAYTGMKNWKYAEDALRKALLISPDDPNIRTELAQIVIRQQRLPEGIQLLKQAIAIAPDNKTIHRQLADALSASGDNETAKSELMLAGISMSNSNKSLIQEGDEHYLNRDYPSAIRNYKNAIEQNETAEGYQKLGDAYLAIGNDEDALTSYQKSLLIYPDDASVHYSIGIILERKGDINGAIAKYERCIELDKNNSDAHRRLAAIYVLKGKLDNAISEYKKILQSAPDNPVVYFKLALAYQQVGKLDDAMTSIKTAIKLDPKNLEPRRELIKLEIKKRNLPNAEKQCKEILAINRDDQQERIRLVGILGKEKKYGELIEFLTEEGTRFPNDNTSFYRLGLVKDYLKDYKGSTQAFLKSIEIQPTAQTYHAIARTYLRLSETKKAREALIEAKKLDPKRQGTQDLIELIDLDHGHSHTNIHKKSISKKRKKSSHKERVKNKN